MNQKVQLDETLRAKLNGLNEEVDFCDESGRVVGHYVPADVYLKLLYAKAKTDVTDEELEAASRQPGGKTTAEILAMLEELRRKHGA
jgi:hypothetical protein